MTMRHIAEVIVIATILSATFFSVESSGSNDRPNGPTQPFTAKVFLQPSNVTAKLSYDPVNKRMAIENDDSKAVTDFEKSVQSKSCGEYSCSLRAVSIEMPKFFVDTSSLVVSSPQCKKCNRRFYLNRQGTMDTQLEYDSKTNELISATLYNKDGSFLMKFNFKTWQEGVQNSAFQFPHDCVSYCKRGVDVALLLDSSASISDNEWVATKAFAKQLGEYSNISKTGFNIGTVVFARDADVYPTKSTRVTYLDVVKEMGRQDTGQTNLGYALLEAKEILKKGRKNAEKAVVFLSDGVVQIYCDPDDSDTTYCIVPGAAARTLKDAVGGVQIYGVTMSPLDQTAAATFDSITPASNQFYLKGNEGVSWTAAYILEEICKTKTNEGRATCDKCPYFMCGCDNKCIMPTINGSIDVPIVGTDKETNMPKPDLRALWVLLPIGLLLIAGSVALGVVMWRRRNAADAQALAPGQDDIALDDGAAGGDATAAE